MTAIRSEGLPAALGKFPNAAIWTIVVGYWIAQYGSLSVQRVLLGADDMPVMYVGRGFVTALAIVISIGMALMYRRIAGKPLSVQLLASMGVALAASVLHAIGNGLIFFALVGAKRMSATPPADYVLSTIGWFWMYVTLAGLLLALSYQDQLVKREAHVRQLEQLATAAHLRALRYQVNPHFLFNALNSIAGLVSKGDNATAEAVIEGMGEFFRAGLAINPLDDIPLQIEVDLQNLYLGVEKLRFQERLEVSIDLSDEARLSLVPSLILQPLMENVVKHAVANSNSQVKVLCEASVERDRLSIRVANSAPDVAAASAPGTGVGLKNVADRLETRFGADHSFSARSTADGGFEVRMSMPHVRMAEG
jgi:signal transduction histidine kinase